MNAAPAFNVLQREHRSLQESYDGLLRTLLQRTTVLRWFMEKYSTDTDFPTYEQVRKELEEQKVTPMRVKELEKIVREQKEALDKLTLELAAAKKKIEKLEEEWSDLSDEEISSDDEEDSESSSDEDSDEDESSDDDEEEKANFSRRIEELEATLKDLATASSTTISTLKVTLNEKDLKIAEQTKRISETETEMRNVKMRLQKEHSDYVARNPESLRQKLQETEAESCANKARICELEHKVDMLESEGRVREMITVEELLKALSDWEKEKEELRAENAYLSEQLKTRTNALFDYVMRYPQFVQFKTIEEADAEITAQSLQICELQNEVHKLKKENLQLTTDCMNFAMRIPLIIPQKEMQQGKESTEVQKERHFTQESDKESDVTSELKKEMAGNLRKEISDQKEKNASVPSLLEEPAQSTGNKESKPQKQKNMFGTNEFFEFALILFVFVFVVALTNSVLKAFGF